MSTGWGRRFACHELLQGFRGQANRLPHRSACATALLLAARALQAGEASDLARRIAQSELDSEQCYRIRDIALTKEDARLYFTDGHILFGKPVAGAPLAAVFVTSVQG